MAANGHIKNYTAADIEKYHQGLLSEKERHDLEKAALDDPFLADALEGYAVAGINTQSDIHELKERLAARLQDDKVVPIAKAGRPFPWLRVAALIIVIGGLGVLANQFLFNKKNEKGIAKLDETKETQRGTVASDSSAPGQGGLTSTNPAVNIPTKPVEPVSPQKTFTVTQNVGGKNKQPVNIASGETNQPTSTEVTVNSNLGSGNVTAPAKVNDQEKGKDDKINKDIAKEEAKTLHNDDKVVTSRNADADANFFKIESVNEDQKKKNAATANRKASDERSVTPGYYNNGQQLNSFRGRVTDANNIGLPFARVYNPTDNNAGTYTDASGNFNLTYPDSVLNVQVKSVGFENTNVQLRSATTNNQVVMQDDRNVSQIVVNNQQPNAAARSLSNNNNNNNVKLEEPEPVDGWINYDAYLTNNLNIPEDMQAKEKASGQVQLSFEVNKEGDPVNIRVEKSLCNKCDKEAIRLVKDGPKWKRNASKKGRTTVTINF